MSSENEQPLSAKEQDQLDKAARSTGPDRGGNKRASLEAMANMENRLSEKDPKNQEAIKLAKLLSANDSILDPGSN